MEINPDDVKVQVELDSKKRKPKSFEYARNPAQHFANESSSKRIASKPSPKYSPRQTLHEILYEDDIQQLRSYLQDLNKEFDADSINALNREGISPLHIAARRGNAEAVILLLKYEANVNLVDADNKLPIHYAAKYYKKDGKLKYYKGFKEQNHSNNLQCPSNSCLEVLIKHGSSVNAQDRYYETPLHYASAKGYTEAVKMLLEAKGIKLEVYNNYQSTPLHEAARHGHVKVVKMLIKVAEETLDLINIKDINGCTALILACREGYSEVSAILLDAANVKTPGGALLMMLDKNLEENTALHFAVESGHIKVVRQLLNIWEGESTRLGSKYGYLFTKDEDGHASFIDLEGEDGNTPLHLAANFGYVEILKALLDKQPLLNLPNNKMATPLHLAAKQNNIECLKLLLQKDCDANMEDTCKHTPVMIACKIGHANIVKVLIDHGVDICTTDHRSRNCLLLAADEGQVDVVLVLLSTQSSKSLTNVCDNFGNNPLHLSASKGYLKVFKLLADSGVRLDERNDMDQSPLHLAAVNGHVDIMKEIVFRDQSTLNNLDEQSRTPLHLTALHGHVNALTKLIELGASPKDIDANWNTPLHLCVSKSHHIDCVTILINADSSIIHCKTSSMETALHIACKEGRIDIIKVLLRFDANVTECRADGRNPLNVAIENRHEACAKSLIEHKSWKDSLRNVTLNEGTEEISTPFRGLIENMPNVAEVVMTKCMSENNFPRDNKDFEILFKFEFLEDMYEIGTSHRGIPTNIYKNTAFQDQDVPETGIRTELNQFDEQFHPDYKEKIRIKSMSYSTNAKYETSFINTKKTSSLQHDIYDENGSLVKHAKPYNEKSSVLSKNHPLNLMVKYKRERLLWHPLVNSLVNYKWKRFGRYMYWANLCSYVVYLISLNIYMLTVPPRFAINATQTRTEFESGVHCITVVSQAEDVWGDKCQNETLIRYLTSILVISFSAVQLAKEILQIWHQKFRYFFDPVNYFEIALYSLSILIFVNVDQLASSTGIREEWQWECGAFAILFSWMNLLLYLRRTLLGIYVFMVASVAKSFFQFGMIIIFFLVGFSFSFYVLLQNQYPFYSPITSCVKTFVMMVGEMDYSDIFLSHFTEYYYENVVNYEVTSKVIFVLFMAIMSLLLTNLLVGIAVDDIAMVQRQATLTRAAVVVKSLLDTEYALPEFLRRRWVVRKRSVFPNKYMKRSFIVRWFIEEENTSVHRIYKFIQPKETEAEKLQIEVNSVKSTLDQVKTSLHDIQFQQEKSQNQMEVLTTTLQELLIKINTN